jgi:Skp family chaperone for outer membrane proteins
MAAARADGLRIAKVDLGELQKQFITLQQKQQELDQARQRNADLLQTLSQYLFLPQESFREMMGIARLPKPWPEEKQKRAEELARISEEKEKQFLALRAKTSRSPEEEDQFKTLQELAEARDADLRQFEQQLLQELLSRQRELQQQLLEQVRSAIAQVAKEKKYDLVLDSEVLLFGGDDITDSVVAILNKGQPAAAQKGPGGEQPQGGEQKK